jgi:hypothetical protein
MRKIALYVVAAVLLLTAGLMPHHAQAASLSAPASLKAAAATIALDEQVGYQCRRVLQCGPSGCTWRRSCLRVCPDSYWCYPLYGGYGPYGGTGYWGGYTITGWGSWRR